MDADTIRKIALEVVQLLPGYGWTWTMLLVQVLLTTLAAGIGVYASSYLKIRAQNLATKADFDSLQDQLTHQTELVETIKSEVSQRDWARREWTNLRRIKLEALLEKMHECELYLDQRRDSASEGKAGPPARDCISELDVLGALYFPELKSVVDRFVINCREQLALMNRFGMAMLQAGNDQAARQIAYNNFASQWRPGDIRADQYALTQAARVLLGRIMNVDEQTSLSDDEANPPSSAQ